MLGGDGRRVCPLRRRHRLQQHIDASGSTNNITGGVHSNDELKFNGSTTAINGATTYVNAISAHPSTVFNPAAAVTAAITNYPVPYQIADYRPGGSAAVAAGAQYYNFDVIAPWPEVGYRAADHQRVLEHRHQHPDHRALLRQGGHRPLAEQHERERHLRHRCRPRGVEGDHQFLGVCRRPHPFLQLAAGLSTYQKQVPLAQTVNCEAPGIRFSGSSHNLSGIMFAPNAQVELSGSNISVNGSLIGYGVKMNGPNIDITYNSTLGGGDPMIELRE